ncbi:FeoA family protein [Lachnospiraceae bacterium 54-53]
MLLSLSPVGEISRIKAIWAEAHIMNILEEAGIAVDCEVYVRLKTYDDVLIVDVNGKRMAIGGELARKIIL